MARSIKRGIRALTPTKPGRPAQGRNSIKPIPITDLSPQRNVILAPKTNAKPRGYAS